MTTWGDRLSSDSGAEPAPRFLLDVYLRDHLAGASAGVSLVRRCRRSNSGTDLAVVLQDVEAEIIAARRDLEAIMSRLRVEKSRLKQAIGLGLEFVGRLKSNGRLFHYSPSSRVVELEMLASAVFTQRSLWLSLGAVVDDYPELDVRQVDRLIAGATEMCERLLAAHDRAAVIAFGTTAGRVLQ